MRPDDTGQLTLFVNGASELSARAIANAWELCDVHLRGRYQLRVIDVHDDPAAVRASGVVAVPALVKNHPQPTRRFVGDMSCTDRVLLALNIPALELAPSGSG